MIKPKYALYRCNQIRACEQKAIHSLHLDENELMLRAGTEAFFFLQQKYPQVRSLAVFCGSGNNAGDGYVLARLAHEHGISVLVYQCTALEDLSSTARNAALLAIASGVECQSAEEIIDGEVELIVDALLGTGIKGPVYGLIASAIEQINESGLPVLSVDVPSGLNADTGLKENLCVRATQTITFIAPKTGLYTLDGPDYCGEIYCSQIGLDSIISQFTPDATLLHDASFSLPLAPRKRNSHKGDYGHVLLIGGGPGMPGAISLAAKAALRTGAGAVSIATWPEHAKGSLSLIPEAMVHGIKTPKELRPLLAKATVCVLGPGLGESGWALELYLAAITSQLPMIIDASALRLLASHPQMDDNWILTPHPGEASELLSCSVREIQSDRYKAVEQIQQKFGGIVVLKGIGSIIHTSDSASYVCPKGNPGMASAGMGDVLTGVIAGLAAQGLGLAEAAKLGVWVHAVCGDRVAKSMGERGLLASDLLDIIPYIVNCG